MARRILKSGLFAAPRQTSSNGPGARTGPGGLFSGRSFGKTRKSPLMNQLFGIIQTLMRSASFRMGVLFATAAVFASCQSAGRTSRRPFTANFTANCVCNDKGGGGFRNILGTGRSQEAAVWNAQYKCRSSGGRMTRIYDCNIDGKINPPLQENNKRRGFRLLWQH